MKQFLKEKLDGRTQRWLCSRIGMNEVDFTNSVWGIHRQFRDWEWQKISDVLGLTEADQSHPDVQSYKFSKKDPKTGRPTNQPL